MECAEVIRLREVIVEKDKEISRLEREVHKLKSVIDKSDLSRLSILNASQSGVPTKKCGVSGEVERGGEGEVTPQRHPKDFLTRQLMRASLSDNEFIKNLDSEQVRDIIEFMGLQTYEAGEWVIREGEQGSHLFICAEGQLEVFQDGNYITTLCPGKAFGELALLYNCKRTASVKAKTFCKVFALARKIFHQTVVKAGMQRMEDRIAFLKSVPFFRELKPPSLLARIADCLELEKYEPETFIIREGAVGNTFFILSEGRVKVTRDDGTVLRELGKGDYFGEQALLRKSQCRSANVLALHPGVECLTLDRHYFIQFIGGMSEFRHYSYSEEEEENFDSEEKIQEIKGREEEEEESQERGEPGSEGDALSCYSGSLDLSTSEEIDPKDIENISLDDLEIIATLGIGGFGRVELVQLSKGSRTFALKCLAKSHIIATQQQCHVYSEKDIMYLARSQFVAKLYKTFKDAKFVYFLMEACLGGEIWTVLRDKGSFDEPMTKFVVGNIIIALQFLHSKDIVYRDLKPENLMINGSNGYIKLVDFGFSKIVKPGQRTWTFCGTAEYVAPEVIINRGHDRSVDLWAMGVLLFELLTGLPPWGPYSLNPESADPLATYNSILKGIESVSFPKSMSRTATNLIRSLCKQNPGERLGAQRGIREVKGHRLFDGFDWEGIRTMRLPSPFEPRLRGPKDTTHFDKFESDFQDVPSDFSGWDADF